MITIDSVSTNSALVTVWDLGGFSNQVVIAPGGHCQVPGVWVNGEQYYGGMECNSSVLISDTGSGPVVTILHSQPDLVYFFGGGVLALTLFGVTALMRLLRAGVRVRRAVYD